jgi:hypothetical protein
VSGDASLSPHVLELLREHVHSIEALEALILLRRTAPRRWTGAQLAAELNAAESAVEAALQQLVASRILVWGGTASSLHYAYAAQDGLRAGIEDLERSYETDPFAVLQAISQSAIARVRDDARRAFRGVFGPGDGKGG